MSLAQVMFDGMIADHRAGQATRVHAGDLQTLDQRILKTEDELCGVFAQRSALEVFVASIYPNHPLVADHMLRDRIARAGMSAGNIAQSYGAARDAGRTFALPSEAYAPVQAQREEEQQLQSRVLELGARLAAANDAERSASSLLQTTLMTAAQDRRDSERLRQELAESKDASASLAVDLERTLRDCAHHMAQSAAFRAQLEQLDPEHPLVTSANLRRRIADAAYAQLVANDGADWNVVREVGRTWVMPKRTFEAEVAGLIPGVRVQHLAAEDLVLEPEAEHQVVDGRSPEDAVSEEAFELRHDDGSEDLPFTPPLPNA